MSAVKLISPSGSVTLEAEDTAGASTVVIPKAGVVEAGTLKEIGVDQVWTQYTVGVNRVAGTTYTNDTGKPIYLSIVISNSTVSSSSLSVTIDGISNISRVVGYGSTYSYNASAIIPNGSTYSAVVNNSVVTNWSELR